MKRRGYPSGAPTGPIPAPPTGFGAGYQKTKEVKTVDTVVIEKHTPCAWLDDPATEHPTHICSICEKVWWDRHSVPNLLRDLRESLVAHFGLCPTCGGSGDQRTICAGQHGCDHGLDQCGSPTVACSSCEGQGQVNQ